MNDVAQQLVALQQMSTGELCERYRELFGQPVRTLMAVEDRMQVTTDATFDALLKVLNAAARDLAEVWTAYDRFCRDRLGVSAETMLTAWEFPTGGEVVEMLGRYSLVKPEPAKVDEYFGLYCGRGAGGSGRVAEPWAS